MPFDFIIGQDLLSRFKAKLIFDDRKEKFIYVAESENVENIEEVRQIDYDVDLDRSEIYLLFEKTSFEDVEKTSFEVSDTDIVSLLK